MNPVVGSLFLVCEYCIDLTFLCSFSKEDTEVRTRENKSKTKTPCSNLVLALFLYFTFMAKDHEHCRILQYIINDFSAIKSAIAVVRTCTIFWGTIHERMSTEKVDTWKYHQYSIFPDGYVENSTLSNPLSMDKNFYW